MNLWLTFLTGLTTGGLSCLAVQGGLLASVIANQKAVDQPEKEPDKTRKTSAKNETISFRERDWLPVGLFLTTKFIAHVLLGFLLGMLGGVITLSLGASLFFQVAAAAFMFSTAMNLLDVHPIFRFVAFQPPKFIARYIRHSTKSRTLFAPALLGFLTIFIPCGVTQAMEVQAINTGSAWQGALILGTFVIGTIPLFATIGIATARLTDTWNKRFLRFTAAVLIFMAVYSVNGVLQVLDFPLTYQKIRDEIVFVFGDTETSSFTKPSQGIQKVTIAVGNSGYRPNRFQVKAGQPVELTLVTKDSFSCANAFVFREFGISARLKPTGTEVFTFTPQKKGKFTYSCSMGMYSGVMEVL
jgi:sulfite exporter TauE/SafE/plastocyanin